MIKKLAIYSLVVFTFYACSKESTPDPISPTSNDSTFVTKIIGLDTTKTAPFDTTYKYLFAYDNSKRLSKGIYILFNNTGTVTDTFKKATYFYNSIDTIPYKLTEIVSEGGQIDYDTSYFFYVPSTSDLASDSIISFDPAAGNTYAHVTKYNRLSNKIQEIHTSYTNHVFQETGVKYWTYQIVNNNLVSIQDTTFVLNSAEIGTFSYDNQFNPLNRIPHIWVFPVYFDDLLGYSANNFTETQRKSKNLLTNVETVIEHHKFFHIYNQYNCPTETRIQDLAPSIFPSLTVNKIKYYYSN